MRAVDGGWIAVRAPEPSEDGYRWRKGYALVRGRVWFGGDQGERLVQGESGERVEASASAIIMKGGVIEIGWGVCAAVKAGRSCDYRISRLVDRGAYHRAWLTWIPPAFRR
ncbi:MAG: hypothetical protein LBH66_08040 [Oscillospiraceae bacterium]|nr:hypothetical protein [Oscillospiraceae bacterium]